MTRGTPLPATRWLAIAAPVILAIAAFWSTLDGGFLSDDFVIGTLWDESTGSANWSRVFADFGRSWFGLDAPLYRPVLTLSFGVDLALHGVEPFGYHVTNLALHALATLATTVVAFVLGTRHGHGPLAALVAGAFVAVHPAVVEPVAWIAARNSGLEVALRHVALACFALSLVRPLASLRVGTWVFGALALAAKESAVVLAPCALAIDVFHSPASPWRERLRRLAPFAVLLVAYFGLRLALFGEFIGSPGASESTRGPAGIALEKLGAVAWPHSPELPLPWLGTAGLLLAYGVAVLGIVKTRDARFALAALALVPLLMVPTHSLELSTALGGSRLILGAVHAFAIVLAACVVATRGWPRIAGAAGAACAALAFLAPSVQRLDAFDDAWTASRGLLRDLGAAGADRADDVPIALLSVDNTPTGTPPLNANSWFPLAQRPFQTADHPLVSLGYAGIVVVPGSEPLSKDPAAARVLMAAGAAIHTWSGDGLVAIPPAGRDPLVYRAEGGGRFVFEQPRSAFDVAVVRGHAPGAAAGTVRLLTNLPADMDTSAPMRIASDGTFTADFTHLQVTILMQPVGVPVRGIEVVTDPVTELHDVRIEREAPPPPHGAPARVEGAASTLDELARRLGPQPGMRVVLLAPQGAVALPTDPESGTVVVPAATRRLLDAVIELSRTKRVWFYVEADPSRDVAPAATPLDHFEYRR